MRRRHLGHEGDITCDVIAERRLRALLQRPGGSAEQTCGRRVLLHWRPLGGRMRRHFDVQRAAWTPRGQGRLGLAGHAALRCGLRRPRRPEERDYCRRKSGTTADKQRAGTSQAKRAGPLQARRVGLLLAKRACRRAGPPGEKSGASARAHGPAAGEKSRPTAGEKSGPIAGETSGALADDTGLCGCRTPDGASPYRSRALQPHARHLAVAT